MSDKPKDTYGFESNEPAEPASSVPASPSPAPVAPIEPPRKGRPIDGSGPAAIASSGKSEPLPLEDEVPMSMRSVKELDVCPNCGAPMRNAGEVLCMRCGFDLKTMKKVEVKTGVVEVAPDEHQEGGDEALVDRRKPITLPGRGETMLPLIAAGVAGVILLIAHLAGVRGLFPPVLDKSGQVLVNGEITFTMRMLGLLRCVVTIAMFTGCGLGALAFVAFLNRMRMGDLRLAAARMLAIVAVAHLATMLNFSSNAMEWTVEAVLRCGIFAGLSIVLFSLKPKDAPILLGSTIILFLLTWFGAWVVVWGTA